MHAIYYFLTEIDDFVDANDLANAIDHDICSYAANWCDENNWWTVQGAVLLDDRRLDLSSEPLLHAAPGAWHGAWKQAYQAIAWTMLFYHAETVDHSALADWLTDPDRTHDEIRDRIHDTVPATLASHYASLASPNGPAGDRLTDYRRACLAREYELFRDSEGETCATFSWEHAMPYEYRAFNLCGNDDANVIVAVDIHT